MMDGTFKLEIELGNDAMSEPEHISDALEHVTELVGQGYTSGPIVDLNGNRVGFFEVA